MCTTLSMRGFHRKALDLRPQFNACTNSAECTCITHPRTTVVAFYACSALIQTHWRPCRSPARWRSMKGRGIKV